MNWHEIILPKLAEWRPAPGRAALHIADAALAWTATLSADRNDELGCLTWELRLDRSGAAAPTATLRKWAEACPAGVTGLLEPLALLEVDADRNEALLRSERPTARGESLYYYELRLSGVQHAELRRFQASHQDTQRTQVVFPITHEALAKVIADITAAC